MISLLMVSLKCWGKTASFANAVERIIIIYGEAPSCIFAPLAHGVFPLMPPPSNALSWRISAIGNRSQSYPELGTGAEF